MEIKSCYLSLDAQKLRKALVSRSSNCKRRHTFRFQRQRKDRFYYLKRKKPRLLSFWLFRSFSTCAVGFWWSLVVKHPYVCRHYSLLLSPLARPCDTVTREVINQCHSDPNPRADVVFNHWAVSEMSLVTSSTESFLTSGWSNSDLCMLFCCFRDENQHLMLSETSKTLSSSSEPKSHIVNSSVLFPVSECTWLGLRPLSSSSSLLNGLCVEA